MRRKILISRTLYDDLVNQCPAFLEPKNLIEFFKFGNTATLNGKNIEIIQGLGEGDEVSERMSYDAFRDVCTLGDKDADTIDIHIAASEIKESL